MAKINKISFTGENQVIIFNHRGIRTATGEIMPEATTGINFNYCTGGNNIIEFHSLPATGSKIDNYLIDGDGSSPFTINIGCSKEEWEAAGFTTTFSSNPSKYTVNWNYNFD